MAGKSIRQRYETEKNNILVQKGIQIMTLKNKLGINNSVEFCLLYTSYEQIICQLKFYKELEVSEQQIREGRTKNARNSLGSMKERYEL